MWCHCQPTCRVDDCYLNLHQSRSNKSHWCSNRCRQNDRHSTQYLHRLWWVCSSCSSWPCCFRVHPSWNTDKPIVAHLWPHRSSVGLAAIVPEFVSIRRQMKIIMLWASLHQYSCSQCSLLHLVDSLSRSEYATISTWMTNRSTSQCQDPTHTFSWRLWNAVYLKFRRHSSAELASVAQPTSWQPLQIMVRPYTSSATRAWKSAWWCIIQHGASGPCNDILLRPL